VGRTSCRSKGLETAYGLETSTYLSNQSSSPRLISRLGTTTKAMNMATKAPMAMNSNVFLLSLLQAGLGDVQYVSRLGELTGVETRFLVTVRDAEPDRALDESEDDERGETGPGDDRGH